MRPLSIGIGGGHSGAGKTTVACEILRRFAGWGAIKYTRTSLYSCIIDDPAVLSEAGKDTRKFLDAGAENVLWIKSPVSELHQVLPIAFAMFSHLQGIVIEGNSAIQIIKPDIVLYVSGDKEKQKSGAGKILEMANMIIFRKDLPASIPDNIPGFHLYDTEGFLCSLKGFIEENRRIE
jgi:molybdopterin-guanine dinucleotide biosynthesis protein